MKVLFRLLLVVLVVFWSGIAFARPTSTSEEIQKLIDSSRSKSVNARFYTVLKGTEIESLKIKIRGVFRQPGLEIIIFTSKHSIAAGMSGSPTYVNGRLMGAVSYSISGSSDEYWGGISPISSMCEDSLRGEQKSNPQSFIYEGKKFVLISLGFESVPGLNTFTDQEFIRTANSDVSDPTISRLNRLALKPGMPIVVDLAEWTDENGKTSTLGAMGTITYIDGTGRIFAFGHPFLNSKNVVYSFRTAEVIGTILSDDPRSSFKITGRTSGVLGAITYDSSYGVYGKIGAKEELKQLRHFNLEFKNKGVFSHKFDIKVADSVMTSTLVQTAFAMIANEYGAPLPQETSVTQIESRIDLEGHRPISWKGLYPSGSMKFGSQVIYFSSFNLAREVFFTNIYDPLYANNY